MATAAGLLLLAGCATTPAPVVNHSFGPGAPAPSAEAPPAPSQPTPTSGTGVQTFGLGHANGTVGTAGYTVAPGDTLYSIAFAHGMDVRTLAAENDIPPPYVIHPGQVLKLQPSQATSAPLATVAAGTTAVAPVPSPRSAAATPQTQPAAPVFGPVTTQNVTANGVAPSASSSTVGVPAAAAPIASANAPPPPAALAPPSPAAGVAATPTPPPGATRTVAGITWQWPASGKVIGGFQAGTGGDGAGLDIAGNVGDPVRAAAAGTVVYSGNGLIGYGELVIIKHNDTYLSAYGHNSKRLVKEGQHVDAGQEIALMGASGAPRVELHFEVRKDGQPVDPLAFLPQR
ncbi:MAG: peptidoglycan DD-metalloendopeptidase family protein [Rhodanobacteraceae bacterium]